MTRITRLISDDGSQRSHLGRLALLALGQNGVIEADDWLGPDELFEALVARLSGHRNFERLFKPAAKMAVAILHDLVEGKEVDPPAGAEATLVEAGKALKLAMVSWNARRRF